MTTSEKRAFSKQARAIGIGLATGLVAGAVVGSRTGDMGWWVSLGMIAGTCIGIACVLRLK